MAGCRPTGWGVTDRASTAVLALVVAFAGTKARRWSWLIVGGGASIVAVAADDNAAKAMAVWALLLAFGSVVSDKRDKAIGALVGGLSINALLRLRGFGGTGASAAVTVASIAPLLSSAYARLAEDVQYMVKRTLAIGAALAAVALLPVIVGAVAARSHIERGIDAVNAGFTATKGGDKQQATKLFHEAESEFQTAHTWVGSWWALPARIVPFGGLQAQLLDVATQQGDDLARAASLVSDTEKDPLSVDAATVSIDSVRSLTGPLDAAASTLEVAAARLERVSSPWLLPPLTDRLDRFTTEVTRALPGARKAKAAIRLAPALLGGDSPRRYFVAFTTPSEARGLGGFVGSWGLLTVSGGHIELTRTGRIDELNDPQGPDRKLDGPAGYISAYLPDYRPQRFFQNVTASPDFHDVGSVAAQLFPQTAVGAPIDGVIVIDPITLAAMLQLTGPVRVTGFDEPLTAENAVRILFFDQYQLFPDTGVSPADPQPGTRESFLANASKATFEAFLSNRLPGPQRFVDALGPAVDQRRFLAYSVHPEEEALFRELGVDGAFPTAPGDFLSFVTNNRGGNKLDAYLHRDVTYDVTLDPNGTVKASATVVLRNDAPASGLPYVVGFNAAGLPTGTNQSLLTMYTPWALDTATVEGQPADVASRPEFGLASYTVAADIPPGASRTVVFTLHGRTQPSATYDLRVAPQPLVNPDTTVVRVSTTGDWRVRPAHGVKVSDGIASIEPEPGLVDDLRVGLDL